MKKSLLLLLAFSGLAFAAPKVCAEDGDIQFTVAKNTGICSRNNSNWAPFANPRFYYWKSTQVDSPVVQFVQDFTDAATIMKSSDDGNNLLQIEAGTNFNKNYSISLLSGGEDYYVSSYSINASTTAGDATINGTTITNTATTYSVTNESMASTLSLNVTATTATCVNLTDFIITVSPRPQEDISNGIRKEISLTTGSLHRDNGNAQTWNDSWVSTSTDPQIVMSVSTPTDETWRYDIGKTTDNKLVFANGSRGGDDWVAIYTVTPSKGYYVSKIEFDVTSGGANDFIIGDQTFSHSSGTTHVESEFDFVSGNSSASFQIKGANNQHNIENFYVTLKVVEGFDYGFFDGKAVTIKNASSRYITAESADGYNVKCWGGNPGLRAVWNMVVEDGKVTFTNAATGKKLNGLGLNNETATAWTLTYVGNDNATVTIANDDNQKLTGPASGFAYASESTAQNDYTWTIATITDAERLAWYNEVTAKVNNYDPAKTYDGTIPGTYTMEGISNETAQEIATKRGTFNSAYDAGGFNFPIAMELFNVTENPASVIFDMSSLTHPALIKWTYAAYAYSKTTPHANRITVGNDESANVFLVEDGTKFYGLDNGRAVVFEESGETLHVYDGEDLTANVASSFLYKPCATAGFYGLSRSTDSKNVGGGSNLLYFWNNTEATAPDAYRHKLEFVPSITVAVNGDLVYRAPVAVELSTNDDIDTYVISVNDDEITTTKVSADGTVYAAGTGFIFHGTGNMTLTAHNGEAGIDTYAANIGGHHKLHNYTTTDDVIALRLATDDELAAVPAAQAEEGPSVSMIAIESHDALAPHVATIELNKAANTKVTANKIVNVPLGATSSTGISEIAAESPAANGAIYDLQGRRLAAPARGLNIINGRKVLVK